MVNATHRRVVARSFKGIDKQSRCDDRGELAAVQYDYRTALPRFPSVEEVELSNRSPLERLEMLNRKAHHHSVAARRILIRTATLVGRTKLPEQRKKRLVRSKLTIPRAQRYDRTLHAEERSPLRGSDLSNSHSGALLTCIDRTTLVGLGRSRAGVGSVGRGDVTAAAILVVFFTLARVSSSLGNGLGILLVLVDSPVKYIVILEALADEEITEDLAEIRVVRLVVETKGSGIVQIDGELVREATAENLGRGRHLLLHDAVILLLLGGSLQTLPGEGATAEVEHDISKGFHVITAGLF